MVDSTTISKISAATTVSNATDVSTFSEQQPPRIYPAEATTTSTEYQKGLLTIGFITLLFSSNSPVLHAAFSSPTFTAPPVLLLNAAVSVVALVGLVLGGDGLESGALRPAELQDVDRDEEDRLALQGGCELGLWKFLGTTSNLYGLALTTAGHGALLIQLTTLIVPVVQGIQGVPIPRRIQASVALALAGVVCFTQDPTGTPSAQGDALCVLAAIFYATQPQPGVSPHRRPSHAQSRGCHGRVERIRGQDPARGRRRVLSQVRQGAIRLQFLQEQRRLGILWARHDAKAL